jgi:hypothetical protein
MFQRNTDQEKVTKLFTAQRTDFNEIVKASLKEADVQKDIEGRVELSDVFQRKAVDCMN